MNFKTLLAQQIEIEGFTNKQIENMLSVPPTINMGDFALPCFSFSKILKTAPQNIALSLAEKLNQLDFVEKCEAVNGYLNIFVNRNVYASSVINQLKQQDFYKQNIGDNKKACIEYSSVNLAKFMHIGHYNCTILGECIARMYEFFGYNVTRINYIGDYGTPFGKMVVAYQLWGNKEKVLTDGVDEIQNLYVKFNKEENEELLNKARYASKMIEDKSGEEYEIYKWFIEISKQKVVDIISRLGITFDDWRGESYYNNKLNNVNTELENAGLLTQSEGAKIIDMNNLGLGVCVIQRSDGGSLYITRDLAAVQDRYERYNFDELVYVTAVQQDSHFDKLFAICKMLNKPYHDKLKHISYGMFSTPEGKIASRKGKQALLEDTLNLAKEKALSIIENRGFEEGQKSEIAEKIASGAMAMSIFKVETTKDKVFDLQTAISFDGETAPYIQYTYARMLSVLKKSNVKANYQSYNIYNDDTAFELLKELYSLKNTLYEAFKQSEPSLIARKVLNICALANNYYNKTRIIGNENESEQLALLNCVNNAIKTCLNLLCVSVLDVM